MNLLITGAWKYTEAQLQEIKALGHAVCVMPDERGELPCPQEWVEGVVCNGLFLYRPIESFPSLTYIQLTSAGFDRVPMTYVREKGITIHNARGVYSVPMAEFAVSSVLGIYKQSAFFGANQATQRWEKHRGLRELFGKTICIVGCGHVGTECAKRFGAFGCTVYGVDALPREDASYAGMWPVSCLRQVMSTADVVVLTLPLTEESHHCVGKDELEALRTGCVLVNIARGAVVDTVSLIEVLSRRRDLCAVLDVFEVEPLPSESPLWSMENVVMTPHNCFVGEGNAGRLWEVILHNLKCSFPG